MFMTARCSGCSQEEGVSSIEFQTCKCLQYNTPLCAVNHANFCLYMYFANTPQNSVHLHGTTLVVYQLIPPFSVHLAVLTSCKHNNIWLN